MKQAFDTADALILALYRLGRELPADAFHDNVFRLLKPSFNFDAAMWCAGLRSAEGTLQVEAARLLEFPTESLVEWQAINREDKVIADALRNAGVVGIYHAPTLFQAPADTVMRDYAARWGRQSFLAVVMPHPDPSIVTGMSLYRPDADHHYVERERAFLQRVMPHINEAFAISQTLHAQTLRPAFAAPPRGVAVTDLGGCVMRADNTFRRLLAMEWPQADDHRLPAPLFRALVTSPGRRFVGKVIRCDAQCTAGMMLLRMRRKTPIDTLSPRRALIAESFAAGLDHKEIARRAGIAPATVRNHLRDIYSILGIRSRRALAAMLDATEADEPQ